MAIILGRKPGGTGGGGGGPPTGPAGGDLSGTYPNPDIAAGAVGTTEIANNAVTAAKVAADVATQAELDVVSADVTALENLNDPVSQLGFGAPSTSFEFTTSSLAGLTALGSPTAENADTTIPDNYYIRQAAAAGISWKGRYLAQATPFTAIAKLTDISGRDQWNFGALFVSEAAPGAMATVGTRFGASFAARIYHVNFTGPTGTDSGGGTEAPGTWNTPLYFCIVANSSDDIDVYFSLNGYLWLPLTVTYNPAWTVGAVGLGINAESASWGVAAAFDYLRIWNSALTMPGN